MVEGTPPNIRPGTAGLIQIITGGSASGTATQVPAEILTLRAGALLEGKVVARDRGGNPILQTTEGNLTLKSSVPLRLGSDVVLQVDQNNQQFKAHIVTIDGRTVQQVLNPQPFEGPDVIVDTAGQRLATALFGEEQAAPVRPGVQTPLPIPLPDPEPVEVRSGGVQTGAAVQLRVLTPSPDAAAQLKTAVPGGEVPARVLPGAGVQIVVQQVVYPPAQAADAGPQVSAAATPAVPGAPAVNPALGNVQAAVTVAGSPPAPAATGAVVLPGVPAAAPAPVLQTTVAGASPPQGSAVQSAVIAQVIAPSPERTSPLAAPGVVSPPAGTPPSPAGPSVVIAANTVVPASAPLPQPVLAGAVFTPQAPALPPMLQPPPGQIAVQVVASDASGETVLHTPFGTVRAQFPAELPVGTQLFVQVTRATPPATANSEAEGAYPMTTPAPAPQRFAPMLSMMSELAQALQQNMGNPAAAQAAMDQAIPQPGTKLGSSMLFFLTALRGGDVRSWIGDQAAQALEQAGKGQLLARLAGGLSQLRSLAAENPNMPWQTFFIPMMNEGQMDHIRLFVRKDKQEEEKRRRGGPSGNTRFVVELELSALGELQLDGLFRDLPDTQKNFQLMLRSRRKLPEDVIVDIRQIFAQAMDATRISGVIDFAVTPTFPVQPLDEVMREPGGGILA